MKYIITLFCSIIVSLINLSCHVNSTNNSAIFELKIHTDTVYSHVPDSLHMLSKKIKNKILYSLKNTSNKTYYINNILFDQNKPKGKMNVENYSYTTVYDLNNSIVQWSCPFSLQTEEFNNYLKFKDQIYANEYPNEHYKSAKKLNL